MGKALNNPFSLTKNIEIQGYDIDYGGVVSNIVYIRWMDDLRTALMKVHYPIDAMARDGIAPVVNKTNAHYKRPSFFGDTLTASIEITMLEKVRWEVSATMINGDDKIVFNAVQSGAFVDLKTGRPVSVPKKLSDIWALFRKMDV